MPPLLITQGKMPPNLSPHRSPRGPGSIALGTFHVLSLPLVPPYPEWLCPAPWSPVHQAPAGSSGFGPRSPSHLPASRSEGSALRTQDHPAPMNQPEQKETVGPQRVRCLPTQQRGHRWEERGALGPHFLLQATAYVLGSGWRHPLTTRPPPAGHPDTVVHAGQLVPYARPLQPRTTCEGAHPRIHSVLPALMPGHEALCSGTSHVKPVVFPFTPDNAHVKYNENQL